MPGTAIFLNPGKETTPLALRAEVEHNHVLHDKVVIVSVDSIGLSHVDAADRLDVEWLGEGLFKVAFVTIRSGYQDTSDVPKLLALARKQGLLARNLDLEHASYFVSRMTITPTDAPGMQPLAQAAVRRHGPQRHQPDHPLRAARRPDDHDGLPGRALSPAPVARRLSAPAPAQTQGRTGGRHSPAVCSARPKPSDS